MILRQTVALFIDAYRELNAKKLFWITMGLNLAAVVLFASLGINDKGVSVFHWTVNSPILNARLISPELFYKQQFVAWGIPFWLSWIATILALVSTAGIIPDLISGGTIETLLSRPIGRVRLFLTKYATGLLFVTLQVFVFSVGCLLVMGIRGGSWVPSLLLAVPIVVLFYSYLFCMCALFGLITRSTIAALLLTLLFWLMVFVVNAGDGTMMMLHESAILRVEDQTVNEAKQVVYAKKRIAQLKRQEKEVPEPIEGQDPLEAVNPALGKTREKLGDARESVEQWEGWSKRVKMLKFVLPKTDETVELLERHLISNEDNAKFMPGGEGFDADDIEDLPPMADPRLAQRVSEARRKRPLWWVLGTSLLFECVVLGVCCLIFKRRDF